MARSLTLIFATALGTCLVVPTAFGEEPRRDVAPPFFPEQLFEQFFPGAGEAAERQLSEMRIALEDERRVGQQMVEAYRGELKRRRLRVLDRGEDVEYLTALVNTLRPYLQNAERYRDIDVFVIDSPLTDARSFPGGTLFFYRGLLDFAESEAALAGVVGHELSHLDRGHQLILLKQSKLFEQAFANPRGFDPQQFIRAGMNMARLMSRPFRPEDEAAADYDGVLWSYRAGYDPQELARLFVRLDQRDGGKNRNVPSFLRTHPYSLDRHAAVIEQFKTLQRTELRAELYIGRENLKQRTAMVRKRFE